MKSTTWKALRTVPGTYQIHDTCWLLLLSLLLLLFANKNRCSERFSILSNVTLQGSCRVMICLILEPVLLGVIPKHS